MLFDLSAAERAPPPYVLDVLQKVSSQSPLEVSIWSITWLRHFHIRSILCEPRWPCCRHTEAEMINLYSKPFVGRHCVYVFSRANYNVHMQADFSILAIKISRGETFISFVQFVSLEWNRSTRSSAKYSLAILFCNSRFFFFPFYFLLSSQLETKEIIHEGIEPTFNE